MSGQDTFVILPTGYGKSIIYGILPMLFDFILGKLSQINLSGVPVIVVNGYFISKFQVV